ncbi:hypothetical protein HC928_25215 [bacterium]|nr:hypothetical protein [bacterium]
MGRSDVVRLRPWVDFTNNFTFSERNNTVEPAAQDEVDYDFTYGLPTLVAGDPYNQNETALVNALAWSVQSQGKITFNLTTASLTEELQGRFQYTVTDRNANTVTNYVKVRASRRRAGLPLLEQPSALESTRSAEKRVYKSSRTV